jgi:hypothetical protein
MNPRKLTKLRNAANGDKGFHRIRHYGLLTGNVVATDHVQHCPSCGGRMVVIEVFASGTHPRHCSSATVGAIRIDTS